MSTHRSFLDSRAAAAIVIAAVLCAAWASAFVLDDAFISFRYAQNLVHAHELTWNPGSGERIEGYTNFLWTMIAAGFIALGIDPVRAATWLGLLFALGTLIVTWRLAARVLGSRRAALLAIVLLGTNYTFIAFATGGLETQMQTFLVVSGAWLAFAGTERDAASIGRAAALSLLFAAALLTRLDSAIPFSILCAYVLWRLARNAGSPTRRAAAVATLVLPAAAIVGAWLVWMHAYYGAVLPNSYYAREAPLSVRTVREGAFYLFEFILSYGLVPFALLAIVSLKGLLAKPGTRIFVIVIAAWCLYVVRESGDFMEFRFLVPVLPFAFIVVTALLIGMLERRVRAVLVITVLLCSLFHAVSYHGSHGIDPVRKMRDYVSGPNGNWREVGRALRDLFPPGGGRVVIAAAAAGTIPYYSELPTVDMFGINDRWIARHGYIVGAHAGHRKGATLQYLLDRGVNLVIGHPLIEDVDVATPAAPYSIEDLRSLLIQDVKGAELPPTARMIDIPIDPGHTVAVLYLVRSEEVDRVVREKRLNVHDIIR